jgi:hypothetical protein
VVSRGEPENAVTNLLEFTTRLTVVWSGMA